ncbi:hypothetical protein HWV62_9573 [Athelia sp. TMB]|nr:hypothetical protein HWV62_9573 [Athelia sp. TMB]
MTRARIPHEILDYIIDQTAHEFEEWEKQAELVFDIDPAPRQLGLLALVSRSFARRSRRHLFHALEVPYSDGETFSALYDLVRSPLATFNIHVTKVTLHPIESHLEDDMIALVAALPNVQHVAFSGAINDERVQRHLPKLLHQIDGLKNLELSFFQLPSFDMLSRIICTGSKLESLRLDAVKFPKLPGVFAPSELLRGIGPPPASLRILRILDSNHRPIYDILYHWLISGPNPPKLNTIHLLNCSTDYPPCIAALFESVGPSLEHLCIDTTLGALCLKDGQAYHLPSQLSMRSQPSHRPVLRPQLQFPAEIICLLL